MQITEVKTTGDRKAFLDLPRVLYKDDPNWVCMLDSELEATFDPSINRVFSRGEAIRWILKDDSGNTIGRVAAFYDTQRSAVYRQKTGGIGFFEVIENQEAAFLLLDTCRDWLASKGMEAFDGPVNFGENDSNWGMLVDGFVQQGYGMPYNKKYYRDFFEAYGFKNYYEQYSYHRDVHGADGKIVEFPPRIMKIAEWLSKRPGYAFRHFEMANRQKFYEDFVEIYNSAWAVFKEDFTPVGTDVLEATFRKAKPIIDQELIWFAYHDEKPIAFFILFPDLNQIIKPFKGKLNFWNKLRFVWAKANHRMTRIRGLVGGVHPSYQNNGVESAIFLHLYENLKFKPWYKELELSWVGDFNPKMIAIYEALGGKRAKTHVTFRYMMDRKAEFIRYKDEMVLNAKQETASGNNE